ncbi:MAG: ERF family protein [Selenomonadaceae bacterium]|nr:ERF family protein [Selenomonadaceae bacterium]
MAIGKKLVAVMAACRYMPQDGYNSFQKYKYTTAAGMFAKINEAMTAEGLFTQVESTLLELRDVTTSKGNAEKHAVVSVKVTITDSETGESVTFTGLGSGQDAGDKSIMKAQTAALKYAYIGGLCIAMSDDPESDSGNTYQPPPKLNGNELVDKCAGCGKGINQKVSEYSAKKYGKPLCMDCQKKQGAPF